MDTDGNGRKSESATASTNAPSHRSTYADSRNDRDESLTVDRIVPVASTELSGPRSTVEIPDGDRSATTDVSFGSTHDADRTPLWDSQGTVPSWVESTLGAWKSTQPVSFRVVKESVPGFEILHEIGRGGMGVVYKARQEGLERFVALKMVRDDWHGNAEHLARFEIEAQAAARLNHPNIVAIYEIGKSGQAPFVVLELLEGGTLKDRLAGTPQPFREAAALMVTLARAVKAAHVAGILHRDLKPSNVLFDQAGVPKIADFGLAKRLEVDDGQTQTGQVIGTPSYMAPEQARGWDKDIGRAADIYSLGAILYEMLTGRPPLKGSTAIETLRLVQEEDPVPPSRLRPKLPFDLETICLKCINRDPRKRYPDALALAEDLERYLAGESILARRTPIWERGIKRARKRPVTAVLVAVGLIGSAMIVEEVVRTDAQARAWQKKEDDRIADLLDAARRELIDANKAMVGSRYEDVRVIAARILSRLAADSDPRLARVREDAAILQARAASGLEEEVAAQQAEAEFRRFVELRDEALFLDTARFGDGLGHSVDATCRAARDALRVFGEAGGGDEWTLRPLPRALSDEDRTEVKNGFYQLLLILADAISLSPGAAPAQRADEAIRVVDRAASVLPQPTKAYFLRRSEFLERKGDRSGADCDRAKAEKLAPVDAVDFFLMGREATRRSDWSGAIDELLAATQKQPDNFWAQCLLAICYLQTGEPVAARGSLNACLQRGSDQAWLFMLRGMANFGIGQKIRAATGSARGDDATALFKDAEADYQRAFDLIGDKAKHADLYYAFLLNRGVMRLLRDDLPAAASDFEEAISLNPRRFEAFADLGQVYQKQNRTDAAVIQFSRAIELRPRWAPLYRARANVLLGVADLSPQLGNMSLLELEQAIDRLSTGRREAAARDLAEAIRLEAPGKQMIAADWTKQAALSRAAGRLGDALAACNAATEIANHYPRAHELRLQVLLELKKYDDLLRSCNAVLEWGEPSARLFELRGIARTNLEDFSGAIGDFTRSLESAELADRPRLLRLRGWSNLANEAHRAAVRDFDAAIRLAPADGDAYLGRGLAQARQDAYREAVRDADRAIKCGNANPDFACRVARIYCQALVAVHREERSTRQAADKLVRDYQQQALNLIEGAIERTPVNERAAFLRKMFPDNDPARLPILKPLRGLEGRLIEQPPPR